MSTAHTSPTFSSVKLPRALLMEAKHTAQAMRRSTAGQIEYWAMLGKAVEDGGLTTREAAHALGLQEGAANTSGHADALIAQFSNFSASGALAQHVRHVIAQNAHPAQALAS